MVLDHGNVTAVARKVSAADLTLVVPEPGGGVDSLEGGFGTQCVWSSDA